MDDSDDYFQDSFHLDENDLAVLDAAEAEYVASISQVPARIPDSLPPPQKRQKVSHSYSSDDVLDVFLRADGTYGVVTVERQDDEDNVPIPESLFASDEEYIATQIVGTISSHAHSPQNPRERPLQRNSSSVFKGHAEQRPTTIASQQGYLSQGFPAESNIHPSYDLHAELTSLKSTIDMLKLENDRVKSDLKDAETARLAKEGEVTMLRKKVEKAAQQHADDLNKMKEAKEATSLEQARIQKEMKQQIERLRTEYIFKQHEIESSSRKAPLSTRTRRTLLGPQMSPVPIPPAMREWNTTRAPGTNKGNLFVDSPSTKERIAEDRGDGRVKTGMKLRLPVPEMKFPGFENSFLQSSPSNSPTRPRHLTSAACNAGTRTPTKGKTAPNRAKNGVLSPVKLPSLSLKPQTVADFDEFQVDDFIQDFDIDMGPNDGSPRSRCKPMTDSSPNTDRGLDSVGDLGFSDDIDRDVALGEAFVGIDWSDELHYILFTHTSPALNTLTSHFLLCAHVTDERYHQSCSAILEALGAKYKFTTLPKLMEIVAENLVMIALILWGCGRVKHLRALFELLGAIMIYIPSFTEAVLQAGFSGQNSDASLLHIFPEVAMRSLDQRKDAVDQDAFTSLTHAMLTFLEATAWTVSKGSYSSLVPFLQSEQMLLTLLDNEQPDSLFPHVINTLLVLASHSSLFQPLLSPHNENPDADTSKSNATGSHRVPLLERLSSFLVDHGPFSNSRTDDELFSVINFFSLLVLQNPEGRAALLRSGTCIPCLVLYLSRLSSTLWEDDELVVKSPEHAKSTVRNLRHALRLLHRLIIAIPTDDPKLSDFDFRHKLFYVQHAMFNGLPHMFIVTVGRLSCADPPDWLDGELQSDIEKLTEPARDLMDLFIEGPESDSVWVAYQDSEGDTVVENDDEMESQLLDIDDDG